MPLHNLSTVNSDYSLDKTPSLWWSKSGNRIAISLFDTSLVEKQTRVELTTYESYQVDYPKFEGETMVTKLTTIDLNEVKMNSVLRPASESGIYLRHVYWLTDDDYLAFWTDRYQSVNIIEHCTAGEIECQQVIKQSDLKGDCYLTLKVSFVTAMIRNKLII